MALPVHSKMKDSAPNLEDRKKGAIKIRQDSPEKVPVSLEYVFLGDFPRGCVSLYVVSYHDS